MSTTPDDTQQGDDAKRAALLGRAANYVDATQTHPNLVASVDEAIALVAHHIAQATVPEVVRDRAVIEVAADLFHRQQTRLGVVGFADNDLNPMRVTRDPMAAARPILAPYLPGGFA